MLASLTSGLTSGLTHFHGLTAYLLVAGLVLGESGFVVGFFVPGEIAVILGGVLARLHTVNLAWMLVAANAAAIGAFFVGYLVGTWIGPWLLTHRPLAGHPAVARTEGLIRRFGGPAAFFSRFLAVVRAVAPGLIGISDVDWRTFAVFNVAGGLVWATGYTFLGWALGKAYAHVVNQIGDWTLLVVAVVVVALVARHLRHRRRAGTRAGGPAELQEPSTT